MTPYFTKNQITFCPYLMTGYPNEKDFFKIIETLIKSGAKIFEFGIPFSDPSADGPILTAINHEMSSQGLDVNYFLNLIAKVKKLHPEIGICIMTYLNTVLQYGFDNFFKFLNKNKIDSFLIPDLPIEEYDLIKNKIPRSVNNVMIVSDNLNSTTIKKISNNTTGYLYVLSSVSITGEKKDYHNKLKSFVLNLRKQVGNDKKLVVGFGIKDKKDIDFLKTINVDGYIIGTAIVEKIKKKGTNFKI